MLLDIRLDYIQFDWITALYNEYIINLIKVITSEALWVFTQKDTKRKYLLNEI